jgi:xylulokinase
MGVLLGIDLGTSGVRAVVVAPDGTLLATGRASYAISAPRPGWAEQDPEEWWRAACGAVREAVGGSGISPREIRAVGLSGQMHGLVTVDRAGRPVRPAIIWPDQRTVEECRDIAERVGEERLYRTAGLPPATGFFGPSLLWLSRHEPAAYARAARAVLPKDYLRYRLTGEWATDVTDGSGTLLFDVARRSWSLEIVRALGIREDLLPRVLESAAVAGAVSGAAAEAGLLPGTPVACGGGDQMMAAVGSGVISEGVAAVSVGTGGQVFTAIRRIVIDPHRRLHTLCHAVPGAWFLMGAILAAGLALRWFRDRVGGPEVEEAHPDDRASARLAEVAGAAEPGSRGLLFLPYLAGERTPHMDPHARGCWVGLSLVHSRADVIRSILEGVAFALREALEAIEDAGARIRAVVATGGGMRSPLWRQILADVLGRPVEVRPETEHSALGAARVAGVATGTYRDLREAAAPSLHGPREVVAPDPGAVPTYERQFRVYTSLYPALREVAFRGAGGEATGGRR